MTTSRRLKFVVCLAVFGIFCAGLWIAPSTAEARRMLRPGLSQSELKAKGQMGHEKARIRWESLTPEQQNHLREVAKQRQQEANQTAKEFWDSLTPEEQQELLAGKSRVVGRAKARWQAKPQ